VPCVRAPAKLDNLHLRFMLNYIWGGLIIFSLVFALVGDAQDIRANRWQNGQAVVVEAVFPANADVTRNQDVRLRIVEAEGDGLPGGTAGVSEAGSSSDAAGEAGTAGDAAEAGDTAEAGAVIEFSARWHPVDDAAEFIIPVTEALPARWRDVAANQQSSRKQELRVVVSGRMEPVGEDGVRLRGEVVLPEVHFVKLRAITQAAFDMAEFAVTLALGLIGIMALWLGLMQIADRSGLIHIVVRGVRPFMKWLFPELPRDHPAMGMVSLNLAANVLGLGNAATPLGIKAMEELQKLNPDKDTATNSMCMFLALNTSSVQLLPPVTLVAIMGLRVNELMVAITITTIFSTLAAILAAKWYARRNPPTEAAVALAREWQLAEATGGGGIGAARGGASAGQAQIGAVNPSAGQAQSGAVHPSAGQAQSGATYPSADHKETRP
jgi:spore maturation protein A